MRAVALIGRIIFGGYWIFSGLNHFLQREATAGYAASKGVPMPEIAVLVSGALILVGGALILIGFKPHIGAWLIVLFLVPVTFMMHNFWADTDPGAKMNNMINFTKNMGLLGAALMISTIKYWPISVEKPERVAL
jgi:putative oxidoreductase